MTRAERRRLMPWSAQIIDEHREFEPCGIWANESGHVVSWPGVKPEFIEVVAVQSWKGKR